MAEAIEMGTISARGQVAIPAEIREKMHLKEGEKVLFMLEGGLSAYETREFSLLGRNHKALTRSKKEHKGRGRC